MMRLLKCLRGRDLDAVRPLLTVPENVPLVISTLLMLFGRPQQMIKSLIEKTKKLPPPREHKPDSIIVFANSLANLVATMKSLNCVGHMSNPALVE